MFFLERITVIFPPSKLCRHICSFVCLIRFYVYFFCLIHFFVYLFVWYVSLFICLFDTFLMQEQALDVLLPPDWLLHLYEHIGYIRIKLGFCCWCWCRRCRSVDVHSPGPKVASKTDAPRPVVSHLPFRCACKLTNNGAKLWPRNFLSFKWIYCGFSSRSAVSQL